MYLLLGVDCVSVDNCLVRHFLIINNYKLIIIYIMEDSSKQNKPSILLPILNLTKQPTKYQLDLDTNETHSQPRKILFTEHFIDQTVSDRLNTAILDETF